MSQSTTFPGNNALGVELAYVGLYSAEGIIARNPYTTPRNRAVGIMRRASDFRSRVSLDRTMPPPTCLRRYLPFSDVILP